MRVEIESQHQELTWRVDVAVQRMAAEAALTSRPVLRERVGAVIELVKSHSAYKDGIPTMARKVVPEHNVF